MSTTTGEDPKVLANYRFARGAVIILSVLIVIALIALLLGFTVHGGGKSGAVVSANSDGSRVTLPSGSHIVSMDVQQNRLILRTRAYGGEEVDIFDTQDGHLVGRVSVPLESGEKPPK